MRVFAFAASLFLLQPSPSRQAGAFKKVRSEANAVNGEVHRRPGCLQARLTGDDCRLPVQVPARMQFHIGSITLQPLKAEAS